MTDNISSELLGAFLAGECTTQERVQVEQWLAESPTNGAHLQLVRELWLKAEEMPAAFSAEDAELALKKTVIASRGVGAKVQKTSATFRYLGIAAAMVIAAFGVKYARSVVNFSSTPKINTYLTTTAQRAKITLADGSTVLLAPATTIRYSEDFGKSNRTIELNGQALFTVTHSAGTPFIIRTEGVDTRVLGTSFTVRKYADDAKVRVVVAEGKVALVGTVLISGDVGVAKSQSLVDVSHGADIARELSWTNGRLHFADTPLRNVLPELSRWYGVKFAADPDLLNSPITAAFDVESTQQAVDFLSLVLRARATRSANGYMLVPESSTIHKR